jgi:hypothetical protein
MGTGEEYRRGSKQLLDAGMQATNLDAADFLLEAAQITATLAVSASIDQLRVAFLAKGL